MKNALPLPQIAKNRPPEVRKFSAISEQVSMNQSLNDGNIRVTWRSNGHNDCVNDLTTFKTTPSYLTDSSPMTDQTKKKTKSVRWVDQEKQEQTLLRSQRHQPPVKRR